jgi:hypothetical protein
MAKLARESAAGKRSRPDVLLKTGRLNAQNGVSTLNLAASR